jgi:predicted lipoprotein with Yx(FWY)xxD motif
VARLISIAVLSAALALVGCGGDDDSPPPDVPEPAAEAEEPAAEEAPSGREGADDGSAPEQERQEPPGTEISTSDSQFGEVLFDGDDQAIYYFEPEGRSEPECYGSCAQAWPPVLTRGEPQASGDARQRLLGTTERRGGSLQVTYDGRPLYYYVDEGAGELRCHNIFHEGGLWLAVQPDGEPVPHNPDETISLD